MQPDLCPCESAIPLKQCCDPLIRGGSSATTAEQLMRSRYTAYALHAFQYVAKTWHPSSRPAELAQLLQNDSVGTLWQGLSIVETHAGRAVNEAYVTFFARYTSDQQPGWIYETSRFVRENNHWYYLDGVHKIPGRNETCPCGSQKKFKKCCAR
ncbi:YchJ family protein [Rosenbergiella metrosideri]|uniref:YchJ family protein n=1 Tax=Rosenbergiella metrosideri TaxID=2921185 RepID=UPI001F500958